MISIIIAILIVNSIPIYSSPLLDSVKYAPSEQNKGESVNYFPSNQNEGESPLQLPPFLFPFDGDTKGPLETYNNIRQYYLPVQKYIDKDSNCSVVLDGFNLITLAQGKSPWAIKMLDSWGKLLDGFLFGNIHAVGMYEECLKIEGSWKKNERADEIFFQGKYCQIFHGKNETEIERSGPGLAIITNPVPYYYATCMPSICSDEEFTTSLQEVFNDHGRQLLKLECHNEGTFYHKTDFDGFDAFVSSLIIVLLVLAIFGTIIEENNLQRYTVTEGGKIFFHGMMCFSLTKSFKHIFSYRKEPNEAITCAHGLRVITLIWIITCHQYETAVDFIVNLANASKYQDPLAGQLITDGYMSVDTFFCLSGILLTYRLFPSILSGKGFTGTVFLKGFLVSLFRRIMRMAPSILMVAMFSATILRFFGLGPRARQMDAYSEQCRDTWWKDPLFINNLVHEDGKNFLQDDCLDHCWYTAVEMQLFLIVPFIFLPRIYSKLVGFWWLAFLTLMSQVIPLIIMIIYEFPPVLFPYLTLEESYDFYTKFYKAPWCRSAPWFIGIWAGIILVKYPHYLKKLNKMHIIIGYAIALILGFVIIVGLYRYNHVGKHSEISNAVSGIYGFFSRPLWAISVSWVVITCYTKNAWYINAILSWWGWQPLSRLTFPMYLISPVVQVWWSNTLFVPIYYSYLAKLFEICGVFFITLFFAILLSCLVEGPVLRLTENLASSKVLKAKAEKREKSLSSETD